MNKWVKEQIEGEPLLEACEVCESLIFNWETLTNSFLLFDGRIACKRCKEELDRAEKKC
jgi:hypothetical protein